MPQTILDSETGPTDMRDYHDPGYQSTWTEEWSGFLSSVDGNGLVGTMVSVAWTVVSGGATLDASVDDVPNKNSTASISGGSVNVPIHLRAVMTYTVPGFASPLTEPRTMIIRVAQR